MGFDTDEGCYTYHYELKDWDLFQCKELDKGKPWDGHTAKDVRRLLSIPAADVAPVVRCKDCKHSILPSELTQRYGKPGTLTCHNRYAPCNRRNVSGDDFCSYGERRDDA